MAEKRKFSYYIIIALVCLALLLCIASIFYRTPIRAEENISAELTPVESLTSDITYRYFDMPTSVYADGAGIVIGGEAYTEILVNDTEFALQKNIPAQKIVRHSEHGDHSEYLIALYNGAIGIYCGSDEIKELGINGIIDFAVYKDTLYAVTSSKLITVPLSTDSFDLSAVNSVSLVSDKHSRISAQAITVDNGTIYVAVASMFGSKSDICSVTNGALETLLMQSDNVLALTSSDGYVYALTRNDLVRYLATDAGSLIQVNVTGGDQLTAVYAYNGYVYAIDTLNALHKLASDLTSDKILLASGSNAAGFFDMPLNASVKYSKLYVADTLNNRIAIYGDDISYTDRKFNYPTAVCYDSAGTAYIAYDHNKVGIFVGGEMSTANERTISDPSLGMIKQITVGTDKTLYILSDTGLWYVSNGENSPKQISDRKLKAITMSAGRDELYALGNDAVYKYANQSYDEALYRNTPENAISISVDLDGKVFALLRDKIICITDKNTVDYPLSYNGDDYTLGGNVGAILFSSISNVYLDYGDILVIDSYKHRIFKTSGKTLGARLIDESYEVPDIANSTELAYYGTEIIRTALRDAEVFTLPMETQPIYTITSGRKVIVPQYTLDETPEYSFILIDDISGGKLIQGYVYKDALSDPLPYSAPPSSTGTVFNAATPIYKWPSRNAQAVKGFAAVNQNTEIKMLEFVANYRDDYGYSWYRVQLDNKYEGYILGINLSLMSYEPVFIRPAYNAEIISYKGSTAAPAYHLEEGIYTQITELPTGTQVEVVGSFDTSEKYTQVKYLDPTLGTLTCYVETVYIKYNGVNIVLIVAVVVIIVTIILASIIIARTVRNKKKRIEDDSH